MESLTILIPVAFATGISILLVMRFERTPKFYSNRGMKYENTPTSVISIIRK